MRKDNRRIYNQRLRESKKPPIEDKVCLNCKVTFTPKMRNNVEHCSDFCTKETVKRRGREETQRKLEALPERECLGCGKHFKPNLNDPRNTLCSYACNITWAKKRSKMKTEVRQKKIKPRTCLTCKQEFMPRIYDVGSKQMQLYCNVKCLQNHPRKRLHNNMSSRLRKACKHHKTKKDNKTFALLGYSKDDLKIRLESQFTDGMTWDNMGKWHIDHIRPVSSFNITSTECEDFKKCWALNNLQPLWGEDNCSKNNKWDGIINK